MPPTRVGGPSAAGHALNTSSHRPHVRHPLREDAPILSSLRPKPFCFPLLVAERHCQGHLHSSSPCRAALHDATLATPLLCSGRRRATDSSKLLSSSCASHRCRADTSVLGANRWPARPLRAPRHRLPSPQGCHGGQLSPATEPVPFDHPELHRRTTVLDNSTNPTG
jgi:hypothetical protein